MIDRFKNSKPAAKGTALAILLVVVIFVLTIASNSIKPTLAYDTIDVGFVTEPCSYFIYAMIGRPDSRYQLNSFEEYDDIIENLASGDIDAALLPARYLNEFAEDGFTIIASTSYLNLVAVERDRKVFNVEDLNGHIIVMPESLSDTLELSMLELLILHAQIDAEIVFKSDSAIQKMVTDDDFDILMLPVDKCADVLLYSNRYRSCFNLASQWSYMIGAKPPAGYCIVATDESLKDKTAEYSNLLTAVKASVNFTKSKRKKSAAYIFSSGVNAKYEYIWKTIPRCRFEFNEGDNLAETLGQLMILTE